MFKKLQNSLKQLKFALTKRLRPLTKRYRKNPTKFVISLATLVVVLLIVANFLKSPLHEESAPTLTPLPVKVLNTNSQSQTEQVFGTVKNLSTVTLVAQTAGPVDRIFVKEGQLVSSGKWLASQETAYGTGNAATLQRQVAEKNLELASQTLHNTAFTVSKTRELADKNRDNTEELRKISDESIDGTKNLLNLTRDVVDKLNSDLESTTDPDTIQTLKTQLVTFKGALTQTETSLKNLEFQVDTDNPPTKISDINKDLVYASTQLQLQSAQLGKDIASLNLKSARIAESLSHISAPFAGTIERIFVQTGQYLTPGTPVAVIKGNDKFQISANLSGATASRIDTSQPLSIHADDQTITINDFHVTKSPTQGSLFELVVSIPPQHATKLIQGQTIAATLPLLPSGSNLENLFIPVDAVFVTNTSRFVYLYQEGVATRRTIETGDIVGSKIQIKSGLTSEDKVIITRQVTENQSVEIVN